MSQVNVGILGTGNIGTDLLVKVLRSDKLNCVIFSGRNLSSIGSEFGRGLGVNISDRGVEAFFEPLVSCDVIFDATSASAHVKNYPRLKTLGGFVIDMTPAHIGEFCVPALGVNNHKRHKNVNMVTCGGQAAIPLAKSIISSLDKIPDYVETISTIASLSAGPGTRSSLDEYILATELGLKKFTNVKKAKALINLNPAHPPITMQTTVMISCEHPNMNTVTKNVEKCIANMQTYVPKYCLSVPPVYDKNRQCLIAGVRVEGRGDYLETYAGNLDIINCAAIRVAEQLFA